MREREALVSALLRDQRIGSSLLWVLAELYIHCELIAKGVRPIALLTLPWTNLQHNRRFPLLKELVSSWDLNIKPSFSANGPIDYYVYAKGYSKDVDKLINLFQRVRLLPRVQRKRGVALHRQIGRIFRYSKEAIEKVYPLR